MLAMASHLAKDRAMKESRAITDVVIDLSDHELSNSTEEAYIPMMSFGEAPRIHNNPGGAPRSHTCRDILSDKQLIWT